MSCETITAPKPGTLATAISFCMMRRTRHYISACNNPGCEPGKQLFHFISFYLLFRRGTKKKQLQNETDIKNANMFK